MAKQGKIFALLCAGALLVSAAGCGGNTDSGSSEGTESLVRVTDSRGLTPEEYTLMNTVGTDALGREISEADKAREGTRYVGIWYSLWLGQHAYMQQGIYDNQVLLSTEEGAAKLASTEDCEETRLNEFHFCSQPLYGYYNMLDPWVVARHIELLTAAGMDYLCFDTTNAVVYPDVATLVLDTLQKYQNQGFKVPKAMFYVNSNAGTTARKIYNEFYQTEKYDDIWFSPNGKPMIVSITSDNGGASDQVLVNPNYTDVFPEELRDRFDLRESQWPQGSIEHDNALPWMSWKYPQSIHPELNAISVSVAQHDPYEINFSAKGPHSSRGYDHTTGKLYANYQEGQNFASQWQSVFDYEAKGRKVENVLVTGWNEWMAIKTWNGRETVFCDVYNEEYSRDIEMMTGSCGDNFYLQLIQNMRAYKYEEAKHYKYQKMSVDISDESLSQWSSVKAHYRDFSGDAQERNYKNAVGTDVYTDTSNRNDITDVKVVHSSTDLFIYVKTKDPVTPYNGTDKNWMTVLINTNAGNEGFEGYDYIVNRSPNADGTTSLEKSQGGFVWGSAGSADYRLYGDVIVYKIPLSALGLTADQCYIRFKVTDNISKPDDIMDYYVSGDSAPIGRLSYSYGY